MKRLPQFTHVKDAIDIYQQSSELTDALRAWIVACLSRAGYPNREIRHELGIRHVYTVTHLKRVGLRLSQAELELWHNHPERITLGHLRPICKLEGIKREKLMQSLLISRQPVSDFEQLGKGKDIISQNRAQQLAQTVGEGIGRPVSIQFSKSSPSGQLILDFASLDELQTIVTALGYPASVEEIKSVIFARKPSSH